MSAHGTVRVRKINQAVLETLESRCLMSAAIAPQIIVPPPVIIPPTVDLTSEPRRILTGSLSNSSTSYTFRAQLNAGDYVAADVDPLTNLNGQTVTGIAASTLTVTAPNGAQVVSVGRSPEPDTGIYSNNAATGFRASVGGYYTFKLVEGDTIGGAYNLDLHRVALASGKQNLADLQQSGAMFAALVGNNLEISGATGYGFAIRGTWTQTLSTKLVSAGFGAATPASGALIIKPQFVVLTSSNYSSTGPIYLETAEGEIQLAVPTGQTFSVTTKYSTSGGVFGEVSSISANIGVPLGSFAANLRQKLGLDMNSISLGGNWTIQLGSTVSAQRGISQVLAGVPYIVYADKAKMNVDFGKINITKNDPAALVAVADPTDPSIYIHYAIILSTGRCMA